MATIAEEAKRDAKWALVGVIVALWAGWKFNPLAGCILASAFLAQALCLWNRKRFGIYLAIAIAIFLGGWFSWLILSKGFTGTRLALVFCFLFAIWNHWHTYGDLLKGKATWQDSRNKDERKNLGSDDPETQENGDAEEDGGKPLTSIVLLRSKPKFLDSRVLLEFMHDAWDGGRKLSGEELFVAGEGPVFMVRSPQGMWLVHNHGIPYFDNEEVPAQIPDLRLRKAVDDHRAWLSVDLMSAFDESLPADVFYPYIFRLIRELADEDTLAILRPETGSINIWNDEVAAALGSAEPLEEFAVPVFAPVIQVSEEDPRMQAAVAEARRDFPIFRKHWEERREGDTFHVKASFKRVGNSEVIWVEVTGLEPEFIHGTLANEPVALGELKMGDVVEVPAGEIYDWGIARKDSKVPLGLFTVKVVAEVEREARQAFRKEP